MKKPDNKTFLLIGVIVLLGGAIAFMSIRLLTASKKEVASPLPPKTVPKPTTYALNLTVGEQTQTASPEASPTSAAVSPTAIVSPSVVVATVTSTPTPTTALIAQASPTTSIVTEVSPTPSESLPQSGVVAYSIVFLAAAVLLIGVAFVI